MWSAIGDGFTYVRESGLAKSVLLRTGTFSVAAVAMLALLPIIARPFGARGYGVLLGCFGLGALLGALALPRCANELSVDGVVARRDPDLCGHDFCGRKGWRRFSLLCAVMLVAGAAWIGILACLNVAAQTMCPAYVRARALSFYLLVLQGGMAVGATMWGALAKRIGVPDALAAAAVVLALGVFALRGHRITANELDTDRPRWCGIEFQVMYWAVKIAWRRHEERVHAMLAVVLAFCSLGLAQARSKENRQPGDRQSVEQTIESDFVPAAEAMPEDKFSFAPTNGEFKGVRTFAQQIKHVAADQLPGRVPGFWAKSLRSTLTAKTGPIA